ncbi:MAG: glycoside hydrolase family 88 protein [Chitinophagaceae bacterium]|jgi:rhamnogalacturonyl hydrolase YesR|nr:glycoside hydrolase family 88 protein [Chitinophagaceae bacterium]
MNRLFIYFIRPIAVGVFILMNLFAGAQKANMKKLIAENFAFADKQYHVLMQNTAADKMPQSFDSSKREVINMNRTWWCTGFYPGSLINIFEETKDSSLWYEALRALKVIEPNQYNTGTHDLGFMMYCSFGKAYALTHDAAYKNILFNSAQSLSTRFRPVIPAIQSWNKFGTFTCPVIIDNMMNLELLEWVSQNGGSDKYANIAIQHANTTMKNHYRPDYSSFHVVDYDTITGKVLQKVTHQGYANNSAWSRGQSWGLYGYVVMYRFTKDQTYLSFAKHIAQFLLKHPNMPKDLIPYWDYDDKAIPNVPRDASAAAILASALLELGQYTSGNEKQFYVESAAKILQTLSSPAYRSPVGGNGGFILMHSTGALPMKSEVDVPLIYADYYFLEALKRYKEWELKN